MCPSSRYELDLSLAERTVYRGTVHEPYLLDLYGDAFAKYHSHNVRPASMRPIATDKNGSPRLTVMRWGWDPMWVSGLVTNARWESVSIHTLLSQAYSQRRCLIPATGYFDWWRDDQGMPTAKFLFRAHHGGLLRIAGLWSEERTVRGWERRFLMLTRHMVLYDQVNHRTPLVLSPPAAATWLNPNATPLELREAIATAEKDDHLTVREVPCEKPSSRADGAYLAKPLSEPWPWDKADSSI